MKIKKSTISNEAIFSDNEKYRYKLTKIWDEHKKKAIIIMVNPSKASELKSDRTVTNVTNFLVDHDYGGLIILNLFAYMSSYTTELSKRENQYELKNIDYIIGSLKECNTVIIAWGSDNKKYITEKRKLEKILIQYDDINLKCFKDDHGKKNRHPRDLTDKWVLDDYTFNFI